MLVGLNFLVLPLEPAVFACILSLLVFIGGIVLGFVLGRKERMSGLYLCAITLFIIAMALPFLVCSFAPILFDAIHVILQPLSLGDLLTYLGTLVGLASAWLIFKYEQKQRHQEQAERVCPALTIQLKKDGGAFNVSVTNCSQFPAFDIQLFDFWLFPVVYSSATCEKHVRFQDGSCNTLPNLDASTSAETIVIIYRNPLPASDEGQYPDTLDVKMRDCEGRQISRSFVHVPLSCGTYRPKDDGACQMH